MIGGEITDSADASHCEPDFAGSRVDGPFCA